MWVTSGTHAQSYTLSPTLRGGVRAGFFDAAVHTPQLLLAPNSGPWAGKLLVLDGASCATWGTVPSADLWTNLALVDINYDHHDEVILSTMHQVSTQRPPAEGRGPRCTCGREGLLTSSAGWAMGIVPYGQRRCPARLLLTHRGPLRPPGAQHRMLARLCMRVPHTSTHACVARALTAPWLASASLVPRLVPLCCCWPNACLQVFVATSARDAAGQRSFSIVESGSTAGKSKSGKQVTLSPLAEHAAADDGRAGTPAVQYCTGSIPATLGDVLYNRSSGVCVRAACARAGGAAAMRACALG